MVDREQPGRPLIQHDASLDPDQRQFTLTAEPKFGGNTMLDTTMSLHGRHSPTVHREPVRHLSMARPGLHPSTLSRGLAEANPVKILNATDLDYSPTTHSSGAFRGVPCRNTSNTYRSGLHARDRSARRICLSIFAVQWTACHVTTNSSTGGGPARRPHRNIANQGRPARRPCRKRRI